MSSDSGLYWDNVNKRLSVGAGAAPVAVMHVSSSSATAGRVDQTSTAADALQGRNIAAASTGAGSGVSGLTSQSNAFGVYGVNANTSGTGVLGQGNNVGGSFLTAGSGGAFTGSQFGAYCKATNGIGLQSTGVIATGNGASASSLSTGQGGAFNGYADGAYIRNTSLGVSEAIYTDNGGAITRVNYWSGTTQYKIIGSGTVSTLVDDGSGNRVVLHAPESPEIYFQDFGQGRLVHGRAHVDIDPVFARNIVVDDKHPLRVFVQVEDDLECKGVVVLHKSADGFDVAELAGGRSNATFQWSVTANRADEDFPNGRHSAYADVRFEPAPEDKEVVTVETRESGVSPITPVVPRDR